MRYQIHNATVTAGGVPIFSHIDMEIKGKEKIAIVGRNGAGKTTLLRLIAGEIMSDRDDKQVVPVIEASRKLVIGMLHQTILEDMEKTVEALLLEGCQQQELFSKEQFQYEMEYDRLFTGFGLKKEEKTKQLKSFSGGEQTKIALIRLLLMKPDILLLDEPTNHLDVKTVEWLEEYLKTYEGAVVMVSHDRFFMDRVANVIYELQDGTMTRYAGNYSQYREQKRKNDAILKKAYERQQEELKRLDDLVERFKHKPNKASFARAKRKTAERMVRIEKPKEDDCHIFTGAIDPLVPSGKWVIEAEHLKIGYDKVLAELSLRIKKGQKIGIVGENGVGKSTFLKTIAGLLEPKDGKLVLGNRTVLGYFDQHASKLTSKQSVLEYFHDQFPALTQKDVRSILGAYLFSGKMAATQVSALSGGEKSRLVLAALLQSRPNLLVLDEPTNHMDIPAKETLESAFQAYTGTILFVSHDRYFIRQVADAILLFEDDQVFYYPFGYEHYLERRKRGNKEELAARLQAEEQALIAGLKAVPKAEYPQLREVSTERASYEWEIGLAEEAIMDCVNRVQWCMEKQQQLEDRQMESCLEQYEAWLAGTMSSEETKLEWTRLKNVQKEAEDAWTKACLDWYTIWEEMHEEACGTPHL